MSDWTTPSMDARLATLEESVAKLRRRMLRLEVRADAGNEPPAGGDDESDSEEETS